MFPPIYPSFPPLQKSGIFFFFTFCHQTPPKKKLLVAPLLVRHLCRRMICTLHTTPPGLLMSHILRGIVLHWERRRGSIIGAAVGLIRKGWQLTNDVTEEDGGVGPRGVQKKQIAAGSTGWASPLNVQDLQPGK